MNNYSTLLLLTLTGAAAVSDLKRGIIPNSLVVTGIACAFTAGILTDGFRGLCLSAAGMCVPLLLLFLLFSLGMMGAGDIKLLCAAGSFLGPKNVLGIICWSFLFGGAISALLLIKRRNFFSRFHYFFEYLHESVRSRHPPPYMDHAGEDGKFCFAVPVFLAVAAHAGGLF